MTVFQLQFVRKIVKFGCLLVFLHLQWRRKLLWRKEWIAFSPRRRCRLAQQPQCMCPLFTSVDLMPPDCQCNCIKLHCILYCIVLLHIITCTAVVQHYSWEWGVRNRKQKKILFEAFTLRFEPIVYISMFLVCTFDRQSTTLVQVRILSIDFVVVLNSFRWKHVIFIQQDNLHLYKL